MFSAYSDREPLGNYRTENQARRAVRGYLKTQKREGDTFWESETSKPHVRLFHIERADGSGDDTSAIIEIPEGMTFTHDLKGKDVPFRG